MITTANTTQGNFAANYKVGIALENCCDLIKQLEKFQAENDFVTYSMRCNDLLSQFIEEQHLFEKKVLEFVS